MIKRGLFISAIALCISAMFIFIPLEPLNGEYRFKDFSSDRERFERYADRAEKSLTEQEWQDILDTGMQEMIADWERNAEAESERYIRQGADAGEVRLSAEESRAAWENDFKSAETRARGAWFLKRENLIFDKIDFSSLKESVKNASADQSVNDIAAWDSYVNASLSGINSQWDIKFIMPLNEVRAKGELLAPDVKAAFINELEIFQKELRDGFEIERDTVLFTGRNLFISELYADADSLKRKSEREAAEAVTDRIISNVESDIKKEEDAILNRSFTPESGETIDFSAMGDDWQDELKRLIELGMDKWNAAREKLYNEMLSWKSSAEEAYDTAEAKWRLALEKLENARSTWERKLSGEIFKGLSDWEKEEESLNLNIEKARSDLNVYMDNLSSQWEDHSSNLVNMAINGAGVYKEAEENIKWLTEMVKKYKNQPAFQNNASSLKTVLDKEINLTAVVNGILAANIAQYGSDSEFAKTLQDIIDGKTDYTLKARLLADPVWDGNNLTEKYEVTVNVPFNWTYLGNTYSWDWAIYTVNWDNRVTPDSDPLKKSAAYHYKTELDRWNSIKTGFAGIAKEAELYMHEKNMLGVDGPGYLTNSSGTYGANGSEDGGDPYLMTGSELQYELAARDRKFWEERLEIAKAVLDYAYPLNGKRESAEATEERKISAKNAMEGAKNNYDIALAGVSEITAELKKIQGQRPLTGNPGDGTAEWLSYEKSIEYLSQKYSQAGEELESAGRVLEARRNALIILENGRDPAYLQKEIEEIEQNILNADLELRKQRKEYYSLLNESENSAITAVYAEKYREAARGREEAKTKRSLISGDVNDANLALWSGNIINSKTLIWGDSTAADENAARLSALTESFKTAEGAEKESLRNSLSAYMRSMSLSFTSEFAAKDSIFRSLSDRDFDPDEFLKTDFGAASVYKNYSDISLKALKLIDGGFEYIESSGSMKNYETLAAYMQGLLSGKQYVYGADNSDYAAGYAALMIFNEKFHGLSPDAWESVRGLVDSEIDISEKIKNLHNNRGSCDIASIENDAASGDMEAIALLREYYLPGSAMAGFEHIESVLNMEQISVESYNQARGFVEENRSVFCKVQETMAGTDYLTGLLGYINAKTGFLSASGEDIVLSENNLKLLTPEQMSIAADAAEEYIAGFERRGVAVPVYIKKMVSELSAMKSGLDASILITDYMNGTVSGTAEEIYSARNMINQTHLKAADFMESADELLNSGYNVIDTARLLASMFNALAEDVKKYISENGNSSIRLLDELIIGVNEKMDAYTLASYAADYASAGSGMVPEDYVSLRGLTGDKKEQLLGEIRPVFNKQSYDTWLADGGTGGVKAFLEAKNITGDDAEELRSYALIKSYIVAEDSGNYTAADPELIHYVNDRKLQDYMSVNPVLSGEDRDTYISRIAGEFAAVNGGEADDYADYMEGFLSGELTSLRGLPDEVKKFAAMDYYFRSVHAGGGTLSEGLIEEFLEERFGAGSLDGDVIDSVTEYARGLRADLLYCGQDIAGYRDSIGDDNSLLFNMGYYAGGASLLPMFESGIYGHGASLGAAADVAAGFVSEALGAFAENVSSAYYGIDSDLKKSDAELSAARALLDFTSTGEGGTCWRDSIFPGNIVLKDEDGNVEKTLVTHMPYDPATGIYDDIDDETSKRDGIKYVQGFLKKDGLEYSKSLLIDNANRMHDIFSAVFKGIKSSHEDEGRITDYLDEVSGIYNLSENYTQGSDGVYSYENGLAGVTSGYTALAGDYAARIFDLESSISGLTGSITGLAEDLKSSRKSYDLMGGGKEELLKLYDEAKKSHDAASLKYNTASSDLEKAQEFYNGRNTEYINRMSSVSSLYNLYKGYEFQYEKAYSIYEYASTPYLKGESINDGGIGDGVNINSGSTDYSSIPLPDARDNYTRIEAKFRESDALFKAAEVKKNTQETVETLNQDSEYTKLKENFVKMTEIYSRTAQVDAQLEQNCRKYETDYINALNKYTATKDGLNIFADLLRSIRDDKVISDDLKKEKISELEEIRNRILSHINTDSDRNRFLNGLLYYSSKKFIGPYKEEYNGPWYVQDWDTEKNYKTRRDEAERFNDLPSQVKADIMLLDEKFGSSESLKTILENYHKYHAAKIIKDWCDDKADDCKFHQVNKKKRWKDREKKYRSKREVADGKYQPLYNRLKNGISTLLRDKNSLAKAEDIYSKVSSVRYLDDVKSYISGSAYALTPQELNALYDESVAGYSPDINSLNVESLRKEKQRLDIDGQAVSARIINGRVVLLDKDGAALKIRDDKGNIVKDASGNILTENYAAGDHSVILKKSGEKIDSSQYAEGETYEFYDNNYNIGDVTGALKNHAARKRGEYYADLMNYVQRTTAEGGAHDYTVVLRDLEKTFYTLQQGAVDFNKESETSQRGYEGYGTVTREYVNNGESASIQGMIIAELIKQNMAFQEQQWDKQKEKFSLRRDRWEEVTGYILNRGNRDWRVKYTEFLNQWKKWRFDARKQIEDGEKWWSGLDADMKGDMDRWTAETSKASSKAAAEKMYAGISERVENYETAIKRTIVRGNDYSPIQSSIDTEKILSNVMKNIPADSIDILTRSMFETDRTAGYSEMLNLGLSGTMRKGELSFDYAEKMDEYRNAIDVMRNLQVLDVLNGIIEGFNLQLEEANKSVYEAVEMNLAKSETFGEAPFRRKTSENRWKIKICVESNLTGDKYKTKDFKDYSWFVDKTVKLQPLKGLNGTTVDFTDANSYINLDGNELNVYVNLEQDELNKRIEEVFKKDGLFSANQEKEFERLADKFGKYYQDWAAGEALLGAGFYAKPMFPNGPNMMVAGAIAASMTGQVWLAVAITAASTALSVADGTTAWKHAGTQFAVSAAGALAGQVAGPAGSMLVNMAASGIKYEKDGGIGWSGKQFKSGVKAGAVNYAVQAGLSYAFGPVEGADPTMSGQFLIGAGSAIVSSGLETDGGWNDFGFDNDNWNQHITAGVSAGVSAGISAGYGSNMRSDMLGQLIQQGVSTAAIKLSGGKGFTDEYRNANRNFNWNSMQPDASKLGSMIGSMAGEYLKKSYTDYNRKENTPQLPHQNGPIDTVETMLEALWYGLNESKKYAGEILSGITTFGGDMIKDFGLDDEFKVITDTAGSAYNTAAGYVNSFAGITRGLTADLDAGVSEFADRTGNWVSGDGFNTDSEVRDIKVARYMELLNNPVMMAANGGTSAGLESEAMAWEQAEANTAEMNKLAAELGISPEDNLKLQQQIMTQNRADDISQEIIEVWKKDGDKTRALLKELRKIDPEAAKQWDGYFKGVRDKEAALAAKKQAENNQVQAGNNSSQGFELDYGDAGPNWGGEWSFGNTGNAANSNSGSAFSPIALSQDAGGPLSKMFQNVFGYSSKQADRLASSACVANSTYTALKMSGANVGTQEEFYRKHLGSDIDAETGWMKTSTADIASSYGKEQVTFKNYDKIGEQDFEYGKATFEKWSDQKQKYIEHTVTIKKDRNGDVRIFSDTGKNSSGNNGFYYKKVIAKERFIRFQYIKK